MQCLDCGARFTKGERRYGDVPYKGLYCHEHDGIEKQPHS
jgi:hypothetical protein